MKGIKVTFKHNMPKKTQEADTKFMLNSAIWLNKVANSFRNRILLGMQQTPKGETSERYNPRRTVQSSIVGNPPAIDTGRLASSITIKRAFPSVTPKAEVFTTVKYAVPLEQSLMRYFMSKESKAWQNTQKYMLTISKQLRIK